MNEFTRPMISPLKGAPQLAPLPLNDENLQCSPTPPLKFNKNKQHPIQSNSSPIYHRVNTSNSYRPPTKSAITATNSRLNSLKSVRPSLPQTITNSATVVLIGDSNCGKTSLVLSYLNKKLATPPESILMETYEKIITFTNQTGIKLQIWDFPGDDYFDRFRPLAYANAKGVLICFTLDRKESLYHIEERWIPEVETHCPDALKIIVGIGSEVRYDKTKNEDVPTFDYCYKYARKLKCKYMECSLVDKNSYNKIFQQLAMLITKRNDVSMSETSGLMIPKTRTNTMTNNILFLDDDKPEMKKIKSKKRVTSFKKKKSVMGCTIV